MKMRLAFWRQSISSCAMRPAHGKKWIEVFCAGSTRQRSVSTGPRYRSYARSASSRKGVEPNAQVILPARGTQISRDNLVNSTSIEAAEDVLIRARRVDARSRDGT